MSTSDRSFLVRHEFLIRRLHSLSGLIPVGAYMVIHLLTNASILDSDAAFQRNVHTIHGLGSALPFIEWTFIFGPLLFHTLIGIMIIRGGLPNSGAYPYGANVRYTLQRVTGIIAMLFIFWHVFHMHGWFHFESWAKLAKGLEGANFKPYNATSSVYFAMQGFLVPVLYFLGVSACVFHLANGIWTMGITWGVWTSPPAQRRAGWACLGFGAALMLVTVGILIGVRRIGSTEGGIQTVYENEKKAIEARRLTGEITQRDVEHKSFTEEEFNDELQKVRNSSEDSDEQSQAALPDVPTRPGRDS